jgi:Cys-rich repeat protein
VPGAKPLPDHVVGNACSDDADCGGGTMTCATALTKVSAPLGYCSQSCALDADCGAGGTCISGVNAISLSLGTCYKSCVPPEACRDGYSCRSFSGLSDDQRGVCTPDRPDDDAGMQ